MKIARRLVAAIDNHAQPIAHPRVAGRAIDVEPLLPALQHLDRCRKRQGILLLAIYKAGVEVLVLVQLIAGNRVEHLRPCRAPVGKKLRLALRNHLRLVLHILPAAGGKQQRRSCSRYRQRPGGACPACLHGINTPPPPLKAAPSAQETSSSPLPQTWDRPT